MKRFAVVALLIPALLGVFTGPARADSVKIYMVDTYTSGRSVVVYGQLVDLASGYALAGWPVCLAFESYSGDDGTYGCTTTDSEGYVAFTAWQGDNTDSRLHYRWECDQVDSYWSDWYSVDSYGWVTTYTY
jgi:hypothetical protein